MREIQILTNYKKSIFNFIAINENFDRSVFT